MENKHIPEIRFSEFTGNWEQRKLGDITESYSGGTPSVGNKLYYGGTIPFIRSAEINSESTELFITADGFNNSSAKMVKEGDILYALYGATSGEVGISKIHGAINQAILAIKPKFGDDSYFITQWLKKQKSTIINTYLQGGQGNLSGSIVKDLIISLPTYKDEQVKIGEFFKQLDEMIALHQQELTTLKQTKQGFLQKMFPKEGESVPEVRFPGFTDEWEECRLGEILEVNSGRDYKHLHQGDIPVYGTGGYMLSVNDKLSDENAIGIGRKGTIDHPQLLKAPFWTVDTLFFMTTKEKNDLLFCYSLANKINWKKYDESTGVPSLSKASIDKISIRIPTPAEQSKIGNFFKHLDDTIALHESELETLKATKKAFLQKMFV
ncbi:restriction endonuclease subunit S [Bacillus glycinifermentans]|uniref:restriction endonuclease subunit S n=1 Tax=Bacillus glycinifermentans TaxID=1664069 RepID=UPI00069FCDDD|nr:restriction endonuclease subunit S [Bacillus glycinifermentans]MEC0496622.1 restriction endonuclease subunit S [Bacillus glycinifermentans]MEC0543061.1 restriction endonuclease subunit S [Bacillus glycinifermentans]